MEILTIREIIDQISRGQIRIPAFQRGFVWDPERVAYLMDSIYKGYPFGSMLFWRTKEKLRIEKDLGPFKLPDPKEDYPVDYVLDGQQRITSIFAVFQTELKMENPNSWLNIYFDLKADAHAQETQFLALEEGQVDLDRYFPLNTLFSTTEYRKATTGLEDHIVERIDSIQSHFKETKIPVQISKTQDKATVAIVFERINRQGVPLDTLQLLSAWTWSEEFQLQEKFGDLADELSPFGFAEVGDDTNLLLRCCSAVLTEDAAPEALVDLKGSEVREKFEIIVNGIRGAVDYLKRNMSVEALSNLPFSTLIVPLVVFFAVAGNREIKYTKEQNEQISKWFWRSAFSRRYSSGVLRNLKSDIVEIAKLRDGRSSALGEFPFSMEKEFYLINDFRLGNVNTKTFILQLAQEKPLSFISGTPVDLAKTLRDSNRTEFHHLMPRSFLEERGFDLVESDSALANLCFLSRADNRELGGVAPSQYRTKMPNDLGKILERSLVPESLFNDDYTSFLTERSELLFRHACSLCRWKPE